MNHLSNSTSPYLLQHAHNPVDWYEWSDESLSRARTENKPIFLSIGYAACHWCHVMAHESFEDETIAAVLNEHFVSIKVDREQRPDIDSIYMSATVALTGSGGWPMSIFLTPGLQPFYAGTYFPPTQRYNMPSFRDVLTTIIHAWGERRGDVDRAAEKVVEHIQKQFALVDNGITFSQQLLNNSVKYLHDTYDWDFGGWGEAPKFPQPMTINFLLRRSPTKDDPGARAALHALKAMARGGMYDVVGGGFSRYSTDNLWKIPHFEKMLYDNAQLTSAYLHAFQITGEPFYRHIVEETIGFVMREMTSSEGGFYSSIDADSEEKEGKFYVWTQAEIQSALGADFEFFKVAYGITPHGNWEGKIVLQRALDDASLAVRFTVPEAGVTTKLAKCHSILLTVRNTRIRPGTDDKILTAWNGLMLSVFAEAATILGSEKQYLQVATRNADFLLTSLRPNGQLRRTWRAGNASEEVFLEDYAALILGLLDLYQADFDNRWFTAAIDLADEMIARFADPAGGFFDTPSDGETLLLRPKDLQDNATPSGNALTADALLRLAAFTDGADYRTMAEQSFRLIADPALRYPNAFGRWLNAIDFALAPVKQIAILGEMDAPEVQKMLKVMREGYRSNLVVAVSSYPPTKCAPALLNDRPLVKGISTAYVCEGFVCKTPVTTAKELKNLL
jgi:uncharacterized protein YyaL (SSP411 family)